jgi:glycosyltransferase involved in cell wall biosynthesis
MSLRVSVVIPTFNHEAYLARAIESALAQTRSPHEVVVVDDGSTDNTRAVVASFGRKIRALRQENRGVAAARNAGVSFSSGEVLAFLDADDEWRPEKLEKQVPRIEVDARVGLVHCGIEEIDSAGHRVGLRLDGLEGSVARDLLLFERGVILGGGSAAIVSKAALADAGGFDESLSISADWDFYYRIASRYQVAFVPELLVRYRRHEANMHANISVMERDMLRAFEKAFGEPPPEIAAVRRRAYGNLHMVLAGSCFRAGLLRPFLRNACWSVRLRPRNVFRLLGYPIRALAHSQVARAG